MFPGILLRIVLGLGTGIAAFAALPIPAAGGPPDLRPGIIEARTTALGPYLVGRVAAGQLPHRVLGPLVDPIGVFSPMGMPSSDLGPYVDPVGGSSAIALPDPSIGLLVDPVGLSPDVGHPKTHIGLLVDPIGRSGLRY